MLDTQDFIGLTFQLMVIETALLIANLAELQSLARA